MNTENRPSAMRLKAGAMRPPPEIGALTPAKALRAALAQAGEDVAALEVVAGKVDEARTTLAPLSEALPPGGLLALVEGPDSRFGLVVLDTQVVAALIEMQTTGHVVARPAEARAPTRTDAIMCADFIDRVLELLEARATEADLDLAPALSGFRYAMALADPRAVAMTLEDLPYRQLSCGLDLASGAKAGRLDLILPFDLPGAGHHRATEANAFTGALEAQVMGAETRLTAVLYHRPMAISAVADLAPGALIPVPRGALEQVALLDVLGRVVAHGRLGQAAGQRAIRLVADAAQTDGAGFDLPTAPAAAGLPPPPAMSAGPPRVPTPASASPPGPGEMADPGTLAAFGGPVEAGDLPDLETHGALGAQG